MKKLILTLVACVLFMGCEGKQGRQPEVGSDPVQYQAVVPPETDNGEMANKNYREYIDNYDPDGLMAFEIEGNFTASGNREILTFYQSKRMMRLGNNPIYYLYCFVLDFSGEKVQEVYEIPYLTNPYLPNAEGLDADLMEKLGRDIIWLGRRIGCIGDFNENGKEEIYLFQNYNDTLIPDFSEFNGTQFVRILECNTSMYEIYTITDIDVGNKIIRFRDTYYFNGSWEDFTYVWSREEQKYVLLEDAAQEARNIEE
jgi:hypothetical protein